MYAKGWGEKGFLFLKHLIIFFINVLTTINLHLVVESAVC